MLKSISYLLAASLVLSACTKNRPNVPVNDAMKRAYAFGTGTYWILRDTITNQEDSMVITNVANTNYVVSEYTYDKIEYQITEYSLSNLTDTAIWSWALVDNQMAFHWIKDNINYEYSPITYPFGSGTFNAVQFSDPDTMKLFNSYKLPDTTYAKVIAVNFLDYGLNDFLYFNADVGFIQVILSSRNKALQLTRYHLAR